MEYTVELDRRRNICMVFIAGEFHSPQDGTKLQHLATQIYAEDECRLFLFDMTQAEVISDAFRAFHIANPPGELARKLRRLRGAILYSNLTEHERFFENAAVNRGFAIKVFDRFDDAVAWLESDE